MMLVNGTIGGLQELLDLGAVGTMTDGELLDRFVSRGDPRAFDAIVRRHAAMVWGVCRRVLADHHDAEDAFQATFLVLARRAASVDPPDRLASWLYGVAHRTAVKACSSRARRRGREVHAPNFPDREGRPDSRGDGLIEALDREVARLPSRYRDPIVLCDLEGRTHAEAARHLGWPVGTVSGRLSRGRALLAQRLSRTIGPLSLAGLAAILSREAVAGCAPPVGAALAFRMGSTSATSRVVALANRVQGGLLMTRIRSIATGLLIVGTAAAGLGVLARGQDEPPKSVAPVQEKKELAAENRKITKTYYIGDMVFPTADLGIDTRVANLAVMEPFVELIQSNIAPGTWSVNGPETPQDVMDRAASITPFFLSISLIIRHDPEVHAKISALLRSLRRIQDRQAAPDAEVRVRDETKNYPVGDLLAPAGGPGERAQASALIDLIASTFAPTLWADFDYDKGGIPGILFDSKDRALVVRHNAVVVKKVGTFLEKLRDFRRAEAVPAADPPARP